MQKTQLLTILLLLLCTIVSAQISADFEYEFSNAGQNACAPTVVTFTNISTGSLKSSLWTQNGILFSNTSSPSKSFSTGGIIQVCLTITGSDDSTDTVCKDLVLVDAPQFDIVTDNNKGCPPFNTNFTIQGLSSSNTVIVDFGDGNIETLTNISNQVDVSHEYNITGSFDLAVTVTNESGCTATQRESQFFEIIPVDQADFYPSSAGLCQSVDTITLINNTPNKEDYNFQWDLSDGRSTNLIEPKVLFANAGSYDITLTATNKITGCTSTVEKENVITLWEQPVITYESVEQPDCRTHRVQFTLLNANDVIAAHWEFGDATSSNEVHPLKDFNTSGYFKPQVDIVTSNGCQITLTTIDSIFTIGPDDVSFDIIGNKLACDPVAGTEIQVEANSTLATGYEWDFAGLSTKTGQNSDFKFTGFGEYSISLKLRYANGCESIGFRDTVIIKPLDISFKADSIKGCEGLQVDFENLTLSGDPITNFLWDFGDGTTSSETNPSHVYSTEGKYSVSLYGETAGGCSNTRKIDSLIRIGVPVNVDFGGDNIEMCLDEEINFTNLSDPRINQFEWHFGDDEISTEENPNHIYGSPDSFNVILTGYYHGCPSQALVQDFVVVHPPKAGFSFSQDCSGSLQISFVNTSNGGDDFSWNFGDGNLSNDSDPTHSFNAPGRYPIALESTNSTTGCTHTFLDTVDLVSPIIDLKFSRNYICIGDTVSIINNSINIDSIDWILPNGASISYYGGGEANHELVFSNAGTFAGIQAVATDIIGCTSTITFPDLFVNELQPSFSYTILGCIPASVQFTNTSNSITSAGVSYLWDFGDGNTSNAFEPLHTLVNPGSYSISLTMMDAYGCSETVFSTSPIVVERPEAYFDWRSANCQMRSIQFENVSSNANIVGYNWDFGDGTTSTDFQPLKSYSSDGSYEVQLEIITNTGCSEFYIDEINIVSPVANFAGDNLNKSCPNPPLITNFTNSSTNSDSWRWDFGDNSGMSLLENPSHIYSDPGMYDVTLIVTSTTGCSDTLIRKEYINLGGPEATFSADTLVGCIGTEVSFTASSNAPYKYNWDFGDGVYVEGTSTQSSQTVSHIYEIGGEFIPTLIIVDNFGCEVSIPSQDTIKIKTLEVFLNVDDSQICEGIDASSPLILGSSGTSTIDSIVWTLPGSNLPSAYGDVVSGLNYESSGTYDVEVRTYAQYCYEEIISANAINVAAVPLADFDIPITGNCANAIISLSSNSSVQGGSIDSYQWATNGINIGESSLLTHSWNEEGNQSISLEVTSDRGCVNSISKNIFIQEGLNLDGGVDQAACIGEAIELRAEVNTTDLISVSWFPSNDLSCSDCLTPAISPSRTTNLTVEVVNNDNCLFRDTVVVVLKPYHLPTVNMPADPVICRGTTAFIDVAGDKILFDYMWNEEQPGLDCYDNCLDVYAVPDTTTVYHLTVTGNGDCSITDSVTVNVLYGRDEVIPDQKAICTGDTAYIDVAKGNNLLWSSSFPGLTCDTCASLRLAPINDIQLTLSYDRDGICFFEEYMELKVLNPDDVTAGADQKICIGDSIQLHQDYDLPISWFPSSLSNDGITGVEWLKITETEDYIIQVGHDQCIVWDTMNALVRYATEINGVSQEICSGESIMLNFIGDADWVQWSHKESLDDDESFTPIASPKETTNYLVTGGWAECPTDTAVVTLVVNQSPGIFIKAPKKFKFGENIHLETRLDVATDDYSFEWSPTTYLSCIDCIDPFTKPKQSISYHLMVTDDNGCVTEVDHPMEMLQDCIKDPYYIPNVFSPNGDGKNDILEISGLDAIDQVQVLNRWGEVVFQSDGNSESWDGTFNGTLAQAGIYICIVDGICRFSGDPVQQNTDVALIR